MGGNRQVFKQLPMTELPKPVFDKTPGGERESTNEDSITFKDALTSAPNTPVYDET